MSETAVYVCRVVEADGVKDYVTLVPPEVMFSRGLSPEEIVGVLLRPLGTDERITPDVFARNRVFVDFLHAVIAKHGPNQPGCKAEAERLGDGFIYIIDQRTPTPQGAVPPEDIIGGFEARAGKVVPGSYRPNENHRILSSAGFFQLGSCLHECLLRELASRKTVP